MEKIFENIPEVLRNFIKKNVRVFVDNSVPTAYVGLRGRDLYMGININFFNSLSTEDKEKLLLHEISHIIRGDVLIPKERFDWRLANIAMDSIINAELGINKIGDVQGYNYNTLQDVLDLPIGILPGWHLVYNKLQEKIDALKEMFNNGNFLDEIKETDNSEEAIEKIIEINIEINSLGEKYKNVIKRASWSKINQGQARRNVKIKIQSTNDIENILKIVTRQNTGARIKRRTFRREGVIEGVKGISRIPTKRILVVVDVSGSFTDYIPFAMGVVMSLNKRFSVDFGVFADTFSMARVGTDIPDVGYGTEINSVLCSKLDYDTLIIITDGDFYSKPKNDQSKPPIIWVVPEGSTKPPLKNGDYLIVRKW